MRDWVEIALQYHGHPFVRYKSPDVGNTPKGFDCSGFVQFVMKEAGVPLPINPGTGKEIRHTYEFFDLFGINIDRKDLLRGDFIFTTRNGVISTHMAIYLGDDKVIHASGREIGKVFISGIDRLDNREITFDSGENKRQIYFQNPIGFRRPGIYVPGQRFQKVLDLSEL